MKDHYVFPAILSFATDGISIEFPDLPGCFSCADETQEALRNAKEALGIHLFGMEKDNEEIPAPSSLENIHLRQNQAVVFIEVWMPLFRDEIENKPVKVTTTIPQWLKKIADENDINYSAMLQRAIKEHLGLKK